MKIDQIQKYNAVIISIAIIIFSFVFCRAAYNFSKQGTYVEVKGLSERIVKADTATWILTYEVKANSIDDLYRQIDENKKTVEEFLGENSIDLNEVSINIENIWQDTYRDSAYRYNATVQVALYTQSVDAVKVVSKDTLSLLEKGVVVNQNYANYEFSDINGVKPEMLAEAIQNAQTSAEEFAKASNSQVGKISRANQGVIDITEKDPGSPEYKKIRVVSTLRFLLK